jgi:hypothetical protein
MRLRQQTFAEANFERYRKATRREHRQECQATVPCVRLG